MEKLIQELEKKNEELESNVASLNQQLTSSKTTAASAPSSSISSASSSSSKSGGSSSDKSSSSSSSGTSNNNSNSSSANGQTNFKNCTELREVHPDGVPKGHAAYQPKMDRDKDGWACE